MMKQPVDVASDVFEMPVETLAVSFTELKRRSISNRKNENMNDVISKGGKSLFRKFVKENRKTDVNQDLAKSIFNIRFGGFIQDPLTLLLQGDPTHLQKVRNAWTHCRLKAPSGYRIDFVGDVTRIAARPLVQGNLLLLEEEICTAINKITTIGNIATQSAISNELLKVTSDVRSPTHRLLHETLGKLIRERKVFCTGPGYHLVTTKTYSGIPRGENTTCARSDSPRQFGSCEMCLKNQMSSISKDTLKQRRQPSAKNDSDYGFITVNTSPSDRDSISPQDKSFHPLADEAISSNSGKARRLQRSKSLDSKRSSIVDRVAEKLFGLRSKSGSRERSKGNGTSLKSTNTKGNGVRHLSEGEAIRLGYEYTAGRQRHSTSKEFCAHGKFVKRSSSMNDRSCPSSVKTFSKQGGASRWVRQRQDQVARLGIPDVIPEKHRTMNARKNSVDRLTPLSFQGEMCLPSHKPGTRRDIGVSCNLEIPSDPLRRSTTGRYESSSKESPTQRKHFSDDPVKEFHGKNVPNRTEEKNTNLSFPRACQASDYKKLPRYSANLHTRNGYVSHEEFCPDWPRRSDQGKRVRRSMSSISSVKPNYLRSSYISPSVRIGSAIADQLKDLQRQRKYYSLQSQDERSLSSNETSVRRKSREKRDDIDLGVPSSSTEHSNELQNNPEAYDVRRESETKNEEPSKLDQETEAALKVAKRLAQLDVKMTRQEWTDYFTSKILPKSVEDALHQSDTMEDNNTTRCENQSYFEKTNGSVETVIDARERTATESQRDSLSSDPSVFSDSISERVRNSSKTEYFTGTDVAARQRPSKMQQQSMHSNRNDFHRRSHSCRKASPSNYPVCQTSWKPIARDDSNTYPYYTCERGHKHFPLCDHHSRVGQQSDNASLTEDSGFHSPRERRSYASWDKPKVSGGTFV